VGCGDGLLRGYISGVYTGIDGEQEAITLAKDTWGDGFICADAVTWAANQRFDAVVLNEVLYYIEDQPAFLAKYFAMVAPNGIMVVSIYDKPTRLWEKNANSAALNNALAFAGDRLQCRIEISEQGKKRTLLVIGHGVLTATRSTTN